MKDNNIIEYDEHKVKRYRIKNGIEFYLIDNIASIEEQLKGEVAIWKASAGVEGRRATERMFNALIVYDPSFGTMPYSVWEEKTRLQVIGTITPHMDSPPLPSDIIVTASGAIRVNKEFGVDVFFKDTSKHDNEPNARPQS